MEDMLIQSANMEIALWQNFGTGRTATATATLSQPTGPEKSRLDFCLTRNRNKHHTQSNMRAKGGTSTNNASIEHFETFFFFVFWET